MSLFKNLYLSNRIFYLLGANICLFLISYSFEFLFYPAIGFMVIILLLFFTEIFILFRSPVLSVNRKVSGVLSLNDDNAIEITITNLSQYVLDLKVIDEIPYQFNERDFKILSTVQKHHTEKIVYQLKPLVRGEYSFGHTNVFIKTFLKLAVKKEATAAEKIVAVYPSVAQMSRQELLALHHPSYTQGENKNRKFGQSYEFDQIRSYIPGDDTRNINWKASSSTNELMINCYEDERSQQIYSLIDKSRVMKMPFNGLTLVDYAINSSLAFSNIVLKKQDKAGLIIFSKSVGATLKADKGARHLKKLMYALYKERYDYTEANYEALYNTVRRTIPNRSLLFLYTNFDSVHALERNIPVLKLLNKNHLLVVVFFENEELENYSKTEADNVLDIYRLTIAQKFVLEKKQIYRELVKHGIQAIKCTPDKLSTATINKYLDLKSRGLI